VPSKVAFDFMHRYRDGREGMDGAGGMDQETPAFADQAGVSLLLCRELSVRSCVGRCFKRNGLHSALPPTLSHIIALPDRSFRKRSELPMFGDAVSMCRVCVWGAFGSLVCTEENNEKCYWQIAEGYRWWCRIVGRYTRQPCIFTDLLDLVDKTQIDDSQPLLAKIRTISQLPLRFYSWCTAHKKHCWRFPVDVDFSGLPCVGFSPSGRRAGLVHPTMSLFIVWAKFHCLTGTMLVILENVPEFVMVFLEFLMGSCYNFYKIGTVCPGDFGFQLVNRERIYILCVHKVKAILTTDPVAIYSHMREAMQMHCGTATEPQHCLLAPREEVMNEVWYKCNKRRFARPSAPRHALNDREEGALGRYHNRFLEKFRMDPVLFPWLVYFLGDDCKEYCCWSAISRAIPTFRVHAGLYWFPAFNRFMTPREKLAAMGFPVYPELADALRVPVMEIEDSHAMGMLAGNCMHFVNAAAILLVALSCVRPA